MRIRAAAVLVLSVMFPSLTFAGTVRPWVGAHGSWSTYDMSDVNSDIAALNASIAGSGLSMDEINGGLGLGLAFGLDLSSRFSLGVGYDHLFASTDVGDPSGSITYNFPANAFRVLGQYSFADVGTSGIYLGGAGGMISEAGSIAVSITGLGSFKSHLKGSGGLFELFAGGDWWAAPQFALSGSAGYRYAKINEIKLDGDTVYLANGEKESIDYSGIFVRAGIKFTLTR